MNKQHYIKTVYKDLLALAVKAGQSVYQNDFNKLSNLKSVRETKDHHLTIQNIFRTHWKAFKAKYEDKLGDSIIDNVERMIDCRDLSKGHLFFE